MISSQLSTKAIMTTTQYNTAYINMGNTNSRIVINSVQHPGQQITVSVKPIMSEGRTVDISIPGNMTISQFHQLIDQALHDGQAFAGIPRPTYGYDFEIALAGQPNAPFDNRIYVEDESRWESRLASEFALELNSTSTASMEQYDGCAFYMRFVYPMPIQHVNDNEIYEHTLIPYDMSNDVDFQPLEPEDLTSNMPVSLTDSHGHSLPQVPSLMI